MHLPTVHAARAFAAMMVLAFHVTVVAPCCDHAFFAGGRGVDLFFVISGFVMLYTHEAERGARAAGRFCVRRIVRIYVPYWIVMFTVWGAGLGHNTTDPVAAFFLWNQGGPAIVQQAWTLTMEVAFYAFFVTYFFCGKAGFAALSSLWLAAVAHNYAHPWYGGLLLRTRVAEFFLGVAAAMLVSAYRGARIHGAWPLASAVLLCVIFYQDAHGRLLPFWDVVNYGPASALLLATGALWDLHRRPVYPRWIMTLGDASYAIYLLHYVERKVVPWVMGYVRPVPALNRWADVVILACMAAIAMTGVLFHWWIERPLVTALNRRLLPPPRPA